MTDLTAFEMNILDMVSAGAIREWTPSVGQAVEVLVQGGYLIPDHRGLKVGVTQLGREALEVMRGKHER